MRILPFREIIALLIGLVWTSNAFFNASFSTILVQIGSMDRGSGVRTAGMQCRAIRMLECHSFLVFLLGYPTTCYFHTESRSGVDFSLSFTLQLCHSRHRSALLRRWAAH